MTETIPVYIKGSDTVLQAEPAPGNQAIKDDTEPGTPTTSQEAKDSPVSENYPRLSQKAEEMLTKMGMIEIEPHYWVTNPPRSVTPRQTTGITANPGGYAQSTQDGQHTQWLNGLGLVWKLRTAPSMTSKAHSLISETF